MSLKPSTMKKLDPLWTKEARLRHMMSAIQRELTEHPGNPSKGKSVSDDDHKSYEELRSKFDAEENDHKEVEREISRIKSEDC